MRRSTRSTRRNRRKYIRRTSRRSQLYRSIQTTARSQVFPFKRFVTLKVNLLGNDTIPGVLGGTSFSLADVPGLTDFTALFDQYKLTGVAYRWVVNKDPMVPTTNKFYPRLFWVHDYDDANTPGSRDELYQYPKGKEFWFTDNKQSTRWYYLKPAKANVGYEGTTNSWYSPDWKSWIDMASTGVPHYGLKYGTETQYAGINIQLQCKYYVLCKNSR